MQHISCQVGQAMVHDDPAVARGTAVGEVGAGEGAGGAGPRPAASSYLEQSRNPVTGRKEWAEVRCVGCRSRFCPTCCLPLGIKLKQRLRPELAKFTGMMMLTLTIDPELFDTPQAAHEYVRRRRCISVAMQRLDRWGLLYSRRYITVIEWQLNGWPHWHVLVDASQIPFEKLCEAWNRNWKAWRDRVAAGRPGFGSVRFSVANFKDHQRAAGYVTAYLTKHPEHGYPAWINDMQVGKVRRFEASRGFWSTSSECQDDELDEDESAGDDGPEDVAGEKSDEDAEDAPRRTIGEQLASCGKSCVVLRVRLAMNEDTGELVTVREFAAIVPATLFEFIKQVPVDEVNARGTVAISANPAALVSAARRWRPREVTDEGETGILRPSDMETHEAKDPERRADAGNYPEGD